MLAKVDTGSAGVLRNKNLKDAAWDFDKLFGKNRLTARSNQFYVSQCRGYYFAFYNISGVTQKENKGHRGHAKDRALPRGQGDN